MTSIRFSPLLLTTLLAGLGFAPPLQNGWDDSNGQWGEDRAQRHRLEGVSMTPAFHGAAIQGAGDVDGDLVGDFFLGWPQDDQAVGARGSIELRNGRGGRVIWRRQGSQRRARLVHYRRLRLLPAGADRDRFWAQGQGAEPLEAVAGCSQRALEWPESGAILCLLSPPFSLVEQLPPMAKVTLTKNGQTYDCPDGTSFLDLCQSQDLPHEFGCTVGSCGTCVCTIPSGAENVNPADDDERETVEMCSDIEGARLGCQVVITGGEVTISQEG